MTQVNTVYFTAENNAPTTEVSSKKNIQTQLRLCFMFD